MRAAASFRRRDGPWRVHSFEHVHEFVPERGGTRMVDRFCYRSPLGPLGLLADALFLERYMRRLLEARASCLKEMLERGER